VSPSGCTGQDRGTGCRSPGCRRCPGPGVTPGRPPLGARRSSSRRRRRVGQRSPARGTDRSSARSRAALPLRSGGPGCNSGSRSSDPAPTSAPGEPAATSISPSRRDREASSGRPSHTRSPCARAAVERGSCPCLRRRTRASTSRPVHRDRAHPDRPAGAHRARRPSSWTRTPGRSCREPTAACTWRRSSRPTDRRPARHRRRSRPMRRCPDSLRGCRRTHRAPARTDRRRSPR
jgi:hypothetical protein